MIKTNSQVDFDKGYLNWLIDFWSFNHQDMSKLLLVAEEISEEKHDSFQGV